MVSDESNDDKGRFILPFQSLAEGCLDNCKQRTDATACEYDYDERACYYFTSNIVGGSGGHDPFYCWINLGNTKIMYQHQY